MRAQLGRGEVKILYVAPERLAMDGFRRLLQRLHISLIAIDEAHCISEWGHEFRPDYRNLRQLRREFPSVPVMALTATATKRVRDDIVAQLDLQQGAVFLSSFNRENLNYSVRPKRDAFGELVSLVRGRRDQSTIVYCYSRRETEELASDLNAQGLRALPYHAGLDVETRRRAQEDFIHDRVPIIVATIAFGMGIDKPDIRLVVHYSMPRSLEGYYQETGRAGRDGLPSDCVLFFTYADKARQEFFIKQIDDASEQQQAHGRLAAMVEFARLQTCRRRSLLAYFGEEFGSDNCGACDNCLGSSMSGREEFDATEIAQKVLSAVVRTGERFGATHIIRVLTGSRDRRILGFGHDRLSVYGIARDYDRTGLREIMEQLEARGLLVQGGGDYATLALGPKGRQFLQGRERISLLRPEGKTDVRGTASRPGRELEYDQGLFERLRDLRRGLADARGVPAFVVFGDVSLRHMAAALPWSMAEFSRIPGVGETKLAEYGPEFVEVIRSYAEANGLQRRTDPAAGQQPSFLDEASAEKARRLPRAAIIDETREMLRRGLSVSEMAQQRSLAESTIVGQIERLVDQGISLEVDHLLPSAETVQEIREAFDVCGDAYLRPVWEFLGSHVSYNDLRLVRMYFRQQGRSAEG